MIMKRIILAILVFCLGLPFYSCGDNEEDATWEEFRDGVPSNESLALKVPAKSENTNELFFGPEVKYLVEPGKVGELYGTTVLFTGVVNFGVMAMLTFLDEVLTYPPTTIEGNVATWGPFPPSGLSAVEVQVVIEKKGENKFAFKFEARPRNGEGEWIAWYEGENQTDGKTARHGKGHFGVNFDDVKKYNPVQPEEGSVEVVYDTISAGRVIDVNFNEFKGKDSEDIVTATYHYMENKDYSGEFEFVTTADIHANLEGGEAYPEKEDWYFNTRWESNGVGRSDVTISGGDISEYCEIDNKCLQKAVFSECWGDDFLVDYSGENYYAEGDEILFSKEFGDEAECALEKKLSE